MWKTIDAHLKMTDIQFYNLPLRLTLQLWFLILRVAGSNERADNTKQKTEEQKKKTRVRR